MFPLNTFEIHPAFEYIRQHVIESSQITVQQYCHKKTGAIHYHLAADHDESAFMVAVRTQPMDSKGEAHILEHTVLCGSEKFPIRDPFFGMMRRSLNTFMNAMTNSDWTAYPFSTQNDKDFKNLLSIYLDALFAPNINALDFSQEGIRVELDDNDKPVFKGVVFNEMKGALSPPSRQLFHHIAGHLYSKTTYHYNAGGEPAEITTLTHEELVAFYKKHYHPSNAIFMTFGKQNVYALHEQFETLALSKFEQGETLFSSVEPRLNAPKQVQETYAIEDQDLKDKTYLALSWLLPTAEDIQLWFGLRLVEGVLLQNGASPLRHYLETCGFAKSAGPILGLNDHNYEMTFSCGVQGANPENSEQFLQGVLEVLADVAAKPVDSKVIVALLHQIELDQREISGSGMPYGLSLMFKSLSSSVHHHDPIHVWDINEALAQVKQKIEQDPMWISNLVQTHLLDNRHRLLLTFLPDANKSAQIRQAEQDKLDQIDATLSVEAREQLRQQAQLLKQRQETAEDHDILPKVTLTDVPADIHIPQGENQNIEIVGQSYYVHVYPTGTNGLYYQQVLIDIPDKVLQSPYFAICTSLIGQVGAGEYDYLQLQQLQTAVSGGFGMSSSLCSDVADKDKISRFLVLNTKSLVQKHDALQLLKLVFEQLRFDEKSRILDILRNQKIGWQSSIVNNGQAYAMQNASRNMSAMARYANNSKGLKAYNDFCKLLDSISQDEQAYAEFINELRLVHAQLLQANRQFLLVCEPTQVDSLKDQIAEAWATAQIPIVTDEQSALNPLSEVHDVTHQAWLTDSNVQFCAQAYPAVTVDHDDAAGFMVLGPYLKNGFLHHAIREQGGAYGGGANYDVNTSTFRFFSYRDPRLAETFADFDASLQWLLQQQDGQQAIESAILTTISGMDKPTSPAQDAIGACHSALHGRTVDIRQRLRQRILNVTLQDLQRIVGTYFTENVVQKSVLASTAKAEQVLQLGFSVHKVY